MPTQYLKIEFELSVKLLQLPLQRSGKALEENLEGACSIFLQKSLILVHHIYWIFRLLHGGWLGCTRAFVKWHLSPYPLKFSLWSTATTHRHCHCTPRHPRARALARLVSSSQGMAGLAWHGMVWLGVRARCFHNEVWWYLPTQYLKIEFGTFCQVIAAPPSAFREGIRRKCRRGFALVHCHHTPTLPLHPPRPPRARARSPRLVKPRHGWLGLAWYGMAWCESQVLS